MNGWVSVKDRLPENLKTVWISDGKGDTTLGCVWITEEGYLWAKSDGIIYEEGGQIMSECELDEIEVAWWHDIPSPPNTNKPTTQKD